MVATVIYCDHRRAVASSSPQCASRCPCAAPRRSLMAPGMPANAPMIMKDVKAPHILCEFTALINWVSPELQVMQHASAA